MTLVLRSTGDTSYHFEAIWVLALLPLPIMKGMLWRNSPQEGEIHGARDMENQIHWYFDGSGTALFSKKAIL